VRVLGIETSSARGSVALIEAGRAVCELEHERANAHGETIQPLIERALASAGWTITSLDRVAVGTGPGSFTGLRVGIALAQGIAEGLEVPLVGIGSLAAMAFAVPPEEAGIRCAVVDARHGELFVGAYVASGRELLEPSLAPDLRAVDAWLGERPEPIIYVGLPARAPERPRSRHFSSPGSDLPHARLTALAAATAPVTGDVRAQYVRQVVAVRPALPPNPLAARTG
jgi:tRNA threonylcarbamoyl adenosine modification protein YeaZ